jgi:hypothetical protein
MSDQPASPSNAATPQELLRLATGFWISQAIFVVAQLGIADLLRDGPRSAAQLAEAVGAHPDALHRILRALAGVGVFREEGEGHFALVL